MVWPNWQIVLSLKYKLLMTPFERSLSKLSENQKLDHDTQVMAAKRILNHAIIRPTELKL